MNWLINNWSLLVVIAVIIFLLWRFFKQFNDLPSEKQLLKVKEWLLYAVIEAEKEFKGGTGKLKLRAVYDMFVQRFPSLVTVVSFDVFSFWVDEALEEMKHLLETNENIKKYVDGE